MLCCSKKLAGQTTERYKQYTLYGKSWSFWLERRGQTTTKLKEIDTCPIPLSSRSPRDLMIDNLPTEYYNTRIYGIHSIVRYNYLKQNFDETSYFSRGYTFLKTNPIKELMWWIPRICTLNSMRWFNFMSLGVFLMGLLFSVKKK